MEGCQTPNRLGAMRPTLAMDRPRMSGMGNTLRSVSAFGIPWDSASKSLKILAVVKSLCSKAGRPLASCSNFYLSRSWRWVLACIVACEKSMDRPDGSKYICDLRPNVRWKTLASTRSAATTECSAHRVAGEASCTCTKAEEASTPWLVSSTTTYTVGPASGAIWCRSTP